MRKYYLISQNKSYKQETDGGFIWCPQTKKDGSFCQNYEFVKNIKIGDIIFSRYNNQLTDIGIAISNCFISDNPFNDVSWNKEGYQVNIKYMKTNCTKKLGDHFNEIKPFLPSKYSPFTKDGGSVQAYAFELSDKLANYFINVFLEFSPLSMQQLVDIDNIESFPFISDEEYMKIDKFIRKKNSKKSTYRVNTEKEAQQAIRNKELGDAGELYVLQMLKDELGNLDEKIKEELIVHAATNKNIGEDLAGFDIVTYTDANEKIVDRYIEVKTTNLDFDEPFYLSKSELEAAKNNPDNYYIYRVYNFTQTPKVEQLLLSKINDEKIIPIKYKVILK